MGCEIRVLVMAMVWNGGFSRFVTVGVDTKEVGLHWFLLVPSALVKLVYLVDIGSFGSPLAGFGWQWIDLADDYSRVAVEKRGSMWISSDAMRCVTAALKLRSFKDFP